MRVLPSSLRFPDLPHWHDAEEYSESVARLLIRAYDHLNRAPGELRSYGRAFDLLAQAYSENMSIRQRVHVCYVLGKACMAIGQAPLAYDYFSEAIELLLDPEDHIDDIKALLHMAFFRATASSWQLKYREAANDLLECRDILRALQEADVTALATFAVNVLADLAGFEFMLERYGKAMEHLAEAGTLLPGIPQGELGPAHVHWVWALLHRWRGDLPRALHSAHIAATLYASADSPVSFGRLQTVIGEVSLDLAEFFPEGDARNSYIMLSTPYTAQALDLARSNADTTGGHLATMLDARLTRLRGDGGNRVPLYECVIRYARSQKDIALLTTAHTQLGYELNARGDAEQASVCFREALASCERTEVSALGVWARRALRQSAGT